MRITEFEAGDIVVRVQAAHTTNDRSYIGEKLKYIGSLNGLLFFEHKERGVVSLRADVFSEGWEHWRNPEEFLYVRDSPAILQSPEYEDELVTIVSNSFKEKMKQTLKEALEEEDYEFLNEIKEIFDQITTSDDRTKYEQ